MWDSHPTYLEDIACHSKNEKYIYFVHFIIMMLRTLKKLYPTLTVTSHIQISQRVAVTLETLQDYAQVHSHPDSANNSYIFPVADIFDGD